MSTDDRLTMALYQAEQDEARRRYQFDRDMNFILSEVEMCALLRQLNRIYIEQNEGTSGPELHALVQRIEVHLGPAKVAEFTTGKWPERLKTGQKTTKK